MNNQQRMLDLKSLALENNWRFALNADASTIPALQKFEFQTGEKRKVERIENLIETANLKIFDVYWKTEFNITDAFGPLAQKDLTAANARQQTIFLFESSDLHLGKFYVCPKDSRNWLNNWIDKAFLQSSFSAYPEFEKRWAVRGAVKELFNKNVIEFYEKSDNFWTFGNANCLFIYQPNVLIESAQILDWVKRIETLAKFWR